jgi:hypothetical protein
MDVEHIHIHLLVVVLVQVEVQRAHLVHRACDVLPKACQRYFRKLHFSMWPTGEVQHWTGLVLILVLQLAFS